ncbi:MAG: TolC family protein [Thiotrichales bacterium]|nr:TolC family protein [Thiotrichales bacterium]
MRSQPLLIGSLCALLALPSFAQVMTLNDAYQLALAKDAKLASSEARLEADKEQKDQALSQLLPQVTASMSAKKELYQLPNNPLSFDENTNNKNLQITQAIYNRQALYGYDQAGLKVDYAKLRLTSAQNELGVRVAQAYLNVLLSQENVALSQQQVATTEQRLNQVTAALKVGYSTKVDRLALVAELDNAQAQLTTDQQQLVFYRQKLKVLIGQSVPDVLPWPQFSPEGLTAEFIQDKSWLELAQNNNLDVQLQKKAVEVAQQEVEVRASGFYPTVNLGAYYADASGATYFAQKNDNKAIYLEMKLPLYQGGYDSSRVREGRSLLRSAEFDAQYASMDATQQAQEQLSNIRASREKLVALKQAIASGEAYLASAEEGYRLGVRDISEVSRAKEKLFSNRRDQSRSTVEMLNSLVQLHAISGQLDATAIAKISQAAWQ